MFDEKYFKILEVYDGYVVIEKTPLPFPKNLDEFLVPESLLAKLDLVVENKDTAIFKGRQLSKVL